MGQNVGKHGNHVKNQNFTAHCSNVFSMVKVSDKMTGQKQYVPIFDLGGRKKDILCK